MGHIRNSEERVDVTCHFRLEIFVSVLPCDFRQKVFRVDFEIQTSSYPNVRMLLPKAHYITLLVGTQAKKISRPRAVKGCSLGVRRSMMSRKGVGVVFGWWN